jgi:hypothetical protein
MRITLRGGCAVPEWIRWRRDSAAGAIVAGTDGACDCGALYGGNVVGTSSVLGVNPW